VTEPALAIDALAVRLGGKPIVRGVSLSVQRGQVVGLFGPSGAGKSTVFRAVVGEVPCDGTVRLAGALVGDLPLWKRARRGLAYVPQGPSVLFELSVEQNLATFARLAGVGVDVRAAAEEVGLETRLDVRAADLSGGERRRLEIARALLPNPRVLICDEPFAGLGPGAIRHVATLLRLRADAGLAVLVSDHHVAEALQIADHAHLLLDGAIEVAEPARVFASQKDVLGRYMNPRGQA
jgi:lipopolysaccharide export system ATP-binding protein